MTKTELIARQSLKIANLEQEIDRLRGHRNEDVEVMVHDGLKLCDWHGAQAAELKPGINVRVNRSGNPHNPFLFARVTEVKVEEGLISVFIELEGIGTAPVIPIDNPYYFFGNLDKAVGELKYETHRITHGGDRCLETITCGELDVVMESVKEAIRQLKRQDARRRKVRIQDRLRGEVNGIQHQRSGERTWHRRSDPEAGVSIEMERLPERSGYQVPLRDAGTEGSR